MKMATPRLGAVLATILFSLAGSLLASPPATSAVRYVRHCYWSHGHRYCNYHRHYYHRYYRHPYCYYHRCYYYRHGWNNRQLSGVADDEVVDAPRCVRIGKSDTSPVESWTAEAGRRAIGITSRTVHRRRRGPSS